MGAMEVTIKLVVDVKLTKLLIKDIVGGVVCSP